MRIQHNIMAMNAYRNYNTNNKALSGNLEKLSSGYKINRAGDDAAGLAISEKMRAQITGLNAAQKNVKDGISLVKTAEGAMQEIQDMLNRMDYLATQSANGTYDNEVDRANLQKEVDALKTEINRIADSANFNGIKLLNGDLDSSIRMDGEADVAVTVVEDGQLGKEPQKGIYTIDFSKTTMNVPANGKVQFTIFGETLSLDALGTGKDSDGDAIAKQVATMWNAKQTVFSGTGTGTKDYGITTFKAEANGSTVTFTMSNAPTKAWDLEDTTGRFTYPTGAVGNNAEEVTVTTVQEAVDSVTRRMYGQASFKLGTTAADGTVAVKDGSAVKIGDETYVFAVGPDSKYKGLENVVDLTDKTTDSADLVRAAVDRLTTAAKGNDKFKVGGNNKDTITVTEKDGKIDYSKNNLAGKDGLGTNASKAVADATKGVDATKDDWSGLVTFGTISSSVAKNGLTLQIGDTSDSFNQMKVKVGDMHTKAMGIAGIDISTQEGAAAAVQTVKDAINYVSGVRGDLGAVQNRLEHTANNLSVMAENIQDAESTIRDTDVAEEMMSYVKNNILVQSAQAMLAQANQVPQGVLQLLG